MLWVVVPLVVGEVGALIAPACARRFRSSAATSRDPGLRGGGPARRAVEVEFDHIQIYTPELRDVDEYKVLEASLNSVAESTVGGRGCPDGDFDRSGRDLVAQLLTGVNWRVTKAHECASTRSVLVAAPGRHGARFLVTAPRKASAAPEEKEEDGDDDDDGGDGDDVPLWASPTTLRRHLDRRGGRGGVGVLGFAVRGSVRALHDRYAVKHPALLVHPGGAVRCGAASYVEAYAYYGDGEAPDEATVLRFVEYDDDDVEARELEGLRAVDYAYNAWSVAAVADHWVSNVEDRVRFLGTLRDVLGFEAKVEFESGVVAAGEAIIESTVSGNAAEAAGDQVFLPINNALSRVGHVAAYLADLGQGVQHVASRVDDLVDLVSKANRMRRATGEGLAFLNIPRSYYGFIASPEQLAKDADVDVKVAARCVAALAAAGLVDGSGVVSLDLGDGNEVRGVLACPVGEPLAVERVATAVERSRYRNLYALLGDRLDAADYLALVENHILVDQQGPDILYQIFTAAVLQRAAGEEAPFLEFIQRACARGEPRPGCGGFGIRNFLTLFLAIELNAAQAELNNAATPRPKDIAKRKLDCLQRQLDASNPILTHIADAQVLEIAALDAGDADRVEDARERKRAAQRALQAVSVRHADEMRKLRLEIAALDNTSSNDDVDVVAASAEAEAEELVAVVSAVPPAAA